jgi:exosortase O
VIGLIFGSLLVFVNVVRIAILVALELVMQLPQLAEMLHQFLGVLGFVISCIIAWVLLLYYNTPSAMEMPIKNQVREVTSMSSLISVSVILVIIIGFVMLYKPIIKPIFAKAQYNIQLAPQYHAKSQKLSSFERDFFLNNNAHIQKLSFSLLDKPLAGSMILVWSKNFKSQHLPENCYIASGYGVSQKGVWVFNQQLAVRFLSLIKNKQHTAIYWFQSATNTTTDYSSRIIDGLFNSARDWVMVSILWDRPVSAEEVSTYVEQIKILIDLELN